MKKNGEIRNSFSCQVARNDNKNHPLCSSWLFCKYYIYTCLSLRSWTTFTKWPISSIMSQFRSDSILLVGLKQLWVHGWKCTGQFWEEVLLHCTALHGPLCCQNILHYMTKTVRSKTYDTLQACAPISVSKLCNFHLPYLVTFVNKLVFRLFP